MRRGDMPKFINAKGTQILICELCRAIEFEEAFVDEGLTYILICQNCGAHHIENAPLKRVGQQGHSSEYNKKFPKRENNA
jgi:hypothetical protein